MKLQWLKEILGEAYTEEMDAKVSTALGERFCSSLVDQATVAIKK